MYRFDCRRRILFLIVAVFDHFSPSSSLYLDVLATAHSFSVVISGGLKSAGTQILLAVICCFASAFSFQQWLDWFVANVRQALMGRQR